MAKRFYGIIPPISTPIDEQENVDEGALRKLVRHTIETGMNGIFVGGSNGESLGLTQKERDRAIRIVLDETAGRLPVLAGVMDTSTRRVIENCKRLEDMGGTTAVVSPTFYSRYTYPSETIRHFEEISRHTNVDLIIYNIPSYTHNTLKAETIYELAKIDKVVGYKDSSGQMAETLKCIDHFRSTDFCILQGMIPSIATAFPKVFLNIYKAAKARDIDKLIFWDRISGECMKLCTMSPNGTSSTKCALSETGLFDGRVTRPLEPVTEQEKESILLKTRKLMEYIDSIQEEG